MKYTVEAKFDNFEITPTMTKIRPSPTEENEFFVVLPRISIPSELKIGTLILKRFLEVSPKCPNCKERLPFNFNMATEIQQLESYIYEGIKIRSINYIEEGIEICFHYETIKVGV